MSPIVPHLWFDTQAVEAASFYRSVFPKSSLVDHVVLKDTPSGDCDLLTITLFDQEFMLISAGPYFKHSPAISFTVRCSSVDEVDAYYHRLIEGGFELMPLQAYDFSERFAWIADRFGVNWQLLLTNEPITQKIIPSLMFVGNNCGKAEEAVKFYSTIFPNSKILSTLRYDGNFPPNQPGTIQQMIFSLDENLFSIMDSAYEHDFTFNEAISLIVYAETQDEIDYYWNALSADPEAEQCGWLKDKYGVSWQVSPRILNDWMVDPDPLKRDAVMKLVLEMKKIEIAPLLEIYQPK
jgi:predicted 3-demethylubiquinone-9 3-methyltransferase (glyoxalase superfamily)